MRFLYTNSYRPPTPSISIEISLPEQSQRIALSDCLIDTGADIVLIPNTYLDELEAETDNESYLRGYKDERLLVQIYVMDIVVNEKLFPSLTVAGYDGTDIIRGRNLLNRLRLLLDGPQQELEIRG